MIKLTCNLLGRLGNNLFQTACLIGLSEKHGVPYGIPANYHHRNIYRFFPRIPLLHNRPNWPTYNENPFKYQEIPFNGNGLVINGFWQTEKYFSHCREKVLETFAFNYKPVEYVSIHVRRGDYLQYPANFPTVTEFYLGKAMEYFKGETFLVFSDDIQWCKDTFNSTYPNRKFIFCDWGNEFDQLSLMASCQHNIIANSSFSWWGAWANRNENKIVISPSSQTWFGPNNPNDDTSDIVPDSWIQLHSRPDNHNQWGKQLVFA